jgi:hypothetical protein
MFCLCSLFQVPQVCAQCSLPLHWVAGALTLFGLFRHSDDPMVMLQNTKPESKAIATLLQVDWTSS